MKYLPLLVFGLLATPAFADDVNVKPEPIPNVFAAKGSSPIVCHYALNSDKGAVCLPEKGHRSSMILVDDVNVPVKPLANETAIPFTVAVDLSCMIQSDASLNDCKPVDGAKTSKPDEDTAIAQINGKGHVTGPFVAGYRTHITVILNKGKSLPLEPIR